MSYYNNKGGYNKPYKKKSGCTFKDGSRTKNGAPCITAWNNSKTRGFITLVACPTRAGEVYTTSSGKECEKWVVTIEFKSTFDSKTFTGFYYPKESALRIPDINMTANHRSNVFCSSIVKQN